MTSMNGRWLSILPGPTRTTSDSGASTHGDVDFEATSPAEHGRARRMAGSVYQSVKGFGGALTALIALCIYLAITQEFFLTSGNILNVLSGASTLLIVSLGLTFVVLTAGFDLSVGAILAASGYMAYRSVDAGLPPVMVVSLSVLLGVRLGGGVNGVLIGKVKLNFFVVTLGTTGLFSGLLYVITDGETNLISAPEGSLMYFIGNGTVGPIPFPIVLSLLLVLICGYVLRFTAFGRAVYAVGGNKEAARLAGINVTAVLVSVYALSGAFAATAGLVTASRLSASSPTAGSTMALTAGAAVLLGGTSFFGGIGGVAGTLVGVMLIAFLQNGLGLAGVSAYWQSVVTGAVLIAAVLLDKFHSRS